MKKASFAPIKIINKKETTSFLTEMGTNFIPKINYIKVPVIHRPKAKALSYGHDDEDYDYKIKRNTKEIIASIDKHLLDTSVFSKDLEDNLLTNWNNELSQKELKKYNEISKLNKLLDTRKIYYYSKDRKIDVEKEKQQVEYMMKNFDKVIKMNDNEAFVFKEIINKKFNFVNQIKFKRVENILDKSRKKSLMIFEKLNKKKIEAISSSVNLGPLFD
jgi:hypothetical protein